MEKVKRTSSAGNKGCSAKAGAFLYNTYIFSIARLLWKFNEKLKIQEEKCLNLFEEIKSRIAVRQVTEHYGLKVNRKGMACCPFHNDKHPSMKIDNMHYHCFGCGAHGDGIGYVAESFGLSQYEAACKINEDFHLGINAESKATEAERKEFINQQKAKKRVEEIQEKFKKWIFTTVNELKECETVIEESQKHLLGIHPHMACIPNGFVYMMHYKSVIGYWLDILCMGTEDDIKSLFLIDGREVSRIAANIKRAGEEVLGRNWKCAG